MQNLLEQSVRIL